MRRLLLAALVSATAFLLFPAAGQAKTKPDLSIAKLRPPPAELAAGEAFTLRGKIANEGEREARANVRASLRRGAEAGPLGLRLARRGVGTVPGGGSERFELAATVPGDTPPGNYGVSACVRKRGNRGPVRCLMSGRRTIVTGGASPGEVGPPGTEQPPDPVFTPGGRSAGDNLFPEIGNGGYDAEHYEVELEYDPAANTFGDGTAATMTARATQNLSEFSLDFQGLTVEAVSVNGTAATFSQDGTKLVIDPPGPGILDGQSFATVVEYTGTPQEVTDPDGSKEGWVRASGPSLDGGFVVNQPIGAQGWFPNNNHPSDKAAYDFVLTVPLSHTALGNGELVTATNNGDGTQTWHWREDDPTASYLTTATTGSFIYSEMSINEALTGRTLPSYWAIDSSFAAFVPAITVELQQMEAMTDFLGELYGPYPFDSTGAVVDSAAALGYALEVQTKPHYPIPLTIAQRSTVLHELAHQWMGDSVSPRRWADIWFNEGWAQWSEWCFEDGSTACPTTPAQEFDAEYANAGNDWTIAPAVLDNDPANLFANFPTYVRGAMTVQGYREIVGQTKFLELSHRVNQDFRHSNISTAQFIALAKEVSAFSGAQLSRLDDYFQQWLYGESKPTITPDNF